MNGVERFTLAFPATNDGYHFAPEKVSQPTTALVHFATIHAGSGSEQEWRARLLNNQVYLRDGTCVQPDTVLRAGDVVTYKRSPWVEPTAPNYFDVLYADEHVLALAKPAGLQVVPKGDFCQRTVVWMLQQYYEQQYSKQYPDSHVPVPVHRLGRGTSGVLLCACTAPARKVLARAFNTSTDLGASASLSTRAAGGTAAEAAGTAVETERPLGKQYRALVTGLMEQDEGEVSVPIGLVNYPGLSSGLFAACAAGKPALSLYRVLHRHVDSHSTLVEVTILTGRPHQIRIHMAALGHPLLGDPLYGPGGLPRTDLASESRGGAYDNAECVMPGDCGYHLHSMHLRFRHPVTGQDMTVSAPVPDRLRAPHET